MSSKGYYDDIYTKGIVKNIKKRPNIEYSSGGNKDLTGRERASIFFTSSRFGLFWQILIAFISFLSAIVFVLDTYSSDRFENFSRRRFSFISNVILALIFLLDFLIHLYIHKRKARFIFSLIGLVDIITIFPTFFRILFPFIFDQIPVQLNFFRVIRFFPLFPIFRNVYPLKRLSEVRFEIIRLIYLILVLAFCASGSFYVAEMVLNHNVPTVNFHTAFYFVVVTFSTVGYGDIQATNDVSRFVVVITIVVGLILVPKQVNDVVQLYTSTSKYSTNRYRQKSEHVIICGNMTYSSIIGFFSEFFHEDHGKRNTKVVVLCKDEPSLDFQKLLRREPFFSQMVTYVQGSPININELKRAGMDSASACFILCNASKYYSDPQEEDNATIMRALAIRKYNETVKIFATLLLAENKKHLDTAGIEMVHSIEEMQLSLLGQSCVCPGFSSFIANLVTSSSPICNTEEHWLTQYSLGCSHELFSIIMPRFHSRMNFCELSEFLYTEYNFTLMGVLYKYTKKKNPIFLFNPGKSFFMDKGNIIFVIARNQDEITNFLDTCHLRYSIHRESFDESSASPPTRESLDTPLQSRLSKNNICYPCEDSQDNTLFIPMHRVNSIPENMSQPKKTKKAVTDAENLRNGIELLRLSRQESRTCISFDPGENVNIEEKLDALGLRTLKEKSEFDLENDKDEEVFTSDEDNETASPSIRDPKKRHVQLNDEKAHKEELQEKKIQEKLSLINANVETKSPEFFSNKISEFIEKGNVPKPKKKRIRDKLKLSKNRKKRVLSPIMKNLVKEEIKERKYSVLKLSQEHMKKLHKNIDKWSQKDSKLPLLFAPVSNTVRLSEEFHQACLERLKQITKWAVPQLKDHIIISGPASLGLPYFIKPLRQRHILENIPIVMLHPEPPPDRFWYNMNENDLEDVYYINGSPLDLFDLDRANISTARVAVLLANPSKNINDQEEFLIDSEAIMSLLSINRSQKRPDFSTITELVVPSNMNFFRITKRQAKDIHLTPVFAAGRIYSGVNLRSLVVQAYFQPNLIPFTQQLVENIVHEEIEQYQSCIKFKKLPKEIIQRIQMGHSVPYIDLFVTLNRKGIIPLALYRAQDSYDNKLPYVYTNPSSQVEVLKSDKIICLAPKWTEKHFNDIIHKFETKKKKVGKSDKLGEDTSLEINIET